MEQRSCVSCSLATNAAPPASLHLLVNTCTQQFAATSSEHTLAPGCVRYVIIERFKCRLAAGAISYIPNVESMCSGAAILCCSSATAQRTRRLLDEQVQSWHCFIPRTIDLRFEFVCRQHASWAHEH